MLSPAQLAAAKRRTILSSCCGVTGETVLTDSAVILLYAAHLVAGEGFALLATAILPLLNGLLVLPMAGLVRFCSCRTLVLQSNFLALAGYLAAVCAGFFPGRAAGCIMLSGIAFFAVCQTGFIAGWLPFLDRFLPPEERTGFLGKMRFFHQLSAVAFLGIASLLTGREPGTGVLQGILLAGAVIFAGRIAFLYSVPVENAPEPPRPDWLRGVKMALANRPLRNFCGYTLFFNMASGAVIPLALLFLKNRRGTAGNTLVVLSTMIFLGMMAGYWGVPALERRFGRSRVFLLLHGLLLASIAGILFLRYAESGIAATALLLMLCNGVIAANSVIASAEIMQRAAPDNKLLAMAFWSVFFYGGNGIARLAAGGLADHSRPYALLLAGGLAVAGLLLFPALKKRNCY